MRILDHLSVSLLVFVTPLLAGVRARGASVAQDAPPVRTPADSVVEGQSDGATREVLDAWIFGADRIVFAELGDVVVVRAPALPTTEPRPERRVGTLRVLTTLQGPLGAEEVFCVLPDVGDPAEGTTVIALLRGRTRSERASTEAIQKRLERATGGAPLLHPLEDGLWSWSATDRRWNVPASLALDADLTAEPPAVETGVVAWLDERVAARYPRLVGATISTGSRPWRVQVEADGRVTGRDPVLQLEPEALRRLQRQARAFADAAPPAALGRSPGPDSSWRRIEHRTRHARVVVDAHRGDDPSQGDVTEVRASFDALWAELEGLHRRRE